MALKESFLIPKYRPAISFRSPNRTPRRDGVLICAASAPARQRRPQNVDGEFFVDHRCIDCDTCRWMAPQVFKRVDEQAAVTKQPSCQEERLKALQALLSCPTSSIHTEKPPKEIKEVQNTFPLPIDEQNLPGVYHCGFHSEVSFGGASYLIVHADGNILVDSPRYNPILAKKIEKLGGVRYMFLTHKDDVADHDKWAKHFGCERTLHSEDILMATGAVPWTIPSSPDVEDTPWSKGLSVDFERFQQAQMATAGVERKLDGEGPWSIGTSADFELIHTPGHTPGSITMYYKPLKVAFTGDHFAKNHENELSIFERFNQQSVSMQLDSVRKLMDLDFKWILPGHGRRVQFKDNQEKNSAIEAFLASKTATTFN